MRIRTLIAGLAVASLTLFGLASVASADDHVEGEPGTTGEEEPIGGTADGEEVPVEDEMDATDEGDHSEEGDHSDEGDHSEEGDHGEGEHHSEFGHVADCVIAAVEDGSDPAKCQEAPNPILPEPDEIIWGGASFLIVLGVMWKFAVPPIKEGMENRTERIRSDLEAADTAKTDAEKTLADYKAELADAKNEANRILEDARASADALKKDLATKAQEEIADMRARAAADVESAKEQALADLRADVAKLAIGAAEAVIEKNLDQATQVQLVENYINQVGSRS